jgi:dihydroorotate dehydrogenase
MLKHLRFNFGTKLLNRLDPELAHNLALLYLKTFYFGQDVPPDDPALKTKIFDLPLKNPIGLAAGFDKNAEIFNPCFSLGFGFVEVGTVTPRQQYGNKRPRLFRLEKQFALINRMGFNNCGMQDISLRLKKSKRGVVGVNIGANADSINKILDYSKVFEFLASYFDFVTINVSSPNTKNLRDLQRPEKLEKIIINVQSINSQLQKKIPILVKVSPDISSNNINDILGVGEDNAIAGLIATNTTTARDRISEKYKTLGGGLSGKPLFCPSNKVLKQLAKKKKKETILIGTGGIFTADDIYEKICIGASAVQIYTAFTLKGPPLLKKLKKDLKTLLVKDGYSSLKEAIGCRYQSKTNS